MGTGDVGSGRDDFGPYYVLSWSIQTIVCVWGGYSLTHVVATSQRTSYDLSFSRC